MGFLNLEAQPLWLVIAAYLAAAAVVWFAGTRASRYADEISRRTGIGGAVIGMVLLGAMTSLPEIATSTAASLGGNAEMAINNMLGGVAFQIFALAVVDAFIGRSALTSTVPSPAIILQSIVCILLLALAVAGTITDNISLLGVGAWSTGMALVYVASIFFVRNQEKRASWVPDRDGASPGILPEEAETLERDPTSGLFFKTALAAAVILAIGFILTRSAEAIAVQTGFDTGLAGLTLLAVATSLPEFSTAIEAVRLKRNDIAIGDVLGGSMFNLLLIAFVDVLHQGPPVLGLAGPLTSFAGILAIILMAIYLIGMIERRDRTFARMGYDSLLVLFCYAGGMALMFGLAE